MARSFASASTQYLEANNPPLTAAPLTMSAWFKLATLTASQSVMSLCDKDALYDYFNIGVSYSAPNLKAVCTSRTASVSNLDILSTATITDTNWHHIVGRFTLVGTSQALYFDGVKYTGGGIESYAPDGIDRISIGRVGRSTPTLYMDGAIAEAAIWNMVLDDKEVDALCRMIRPYLIRPANLVAYYPLLQQNDRDAKGTYHLSPSANAPTWTDHVPVWMPKLYPQMEGVGSSGQPVALRDWVKHTGRSWRSGRGL